MHCHTEFHEAEGMALIFKEGNHSQMNDKPRAMNTCGNFYMKSEDFTQAVKKPVSLGKGTLCVVMDQG